MQKRFIAGAVCPRCSAMDRIVMFTSEEGTFRECVDCGFQDKQADPEEDMAGGAELKTRVSPKADPAPPGKDDTVQPIRFVPGSGTRQ